MGGPGCSRQSAGPRETIQGHLGLDSVAPVIQGLSQGGQRSTQGAGGLRTWCQAEIQGEPLRLLPTHLTRDLERTVTGIPEFTACPDGGLLKDKLNGA